MSSFGRVRGGSFNKRAAVQGPRNRGSSLSQVMGQGQGQGTTEAQTLPQALESFDRVIPAHLELPQYTIIPEHLEPLGDTGLFISPNEAVEPTDCERYPNSPWCGGTGTGDDLIGLDPEITTNGCETCITITPSLFFIGLPPLQVCYRSPTCAPLPYRPDPPETDPAETTDPPVYHAISGDFSYPCFWRIYYTRQSYSYETKEIIDITTYTEAGRPHGYYTWRANGFMAFGGWQHTGDCHFISIYSLNRYGELTLSRFTYSGAVGEPIDGSGPHYYAPYRVVDAIPSDSFQNETCIPEPSNLPNQRNTPPPRPNRNMCNCQETQELLRLIARRLGTQDYPVTVPKQLIGDSNETQKQESLTQFMAWLTTQLDGLLGEFPIKFKIKDADPTREGNQTREVELKNLAEAMAEVYGLSLRSSINSDIHTSFLMRLAAEVVATKNASLITQDYAKANASYLGYKGNPVKRKINYAFNISQLENLEKILQESEKIIIGWQDEDKNTVQDYLEKLMFAAGIIKQTYFRPNGYRDKLIEEISNALGINPNPEQESEEDSKWRAFLQAINNPQGGFNRNSPIIPEVLDPQISLEDQVALDGFDSFDRIGGEDGSANDQ